MGPAKPPLSFHASGCPATVGYTIPGLVPPETAIPMSWLMPAFCVQRSALAERIAVELAAGVIFSTRWVASIGCQALPSLFCNAYWLLLMVVYTDPGIVARTVEEAIPPVRAAPGTVTGEVPAGAKAWVAITVA